MGEPSDEPAKAAEKPQRVASFVIGAVLGVVLSSLFPGPRVNTLAIRSICGANLNRLGRQFIVYRTEYESTPRDLQTLLDTGDPFPSRFSCPGWPGTEKVGADAPLKDRCDYVWTAPPDFGSEGREIAAFELPGNHRNEGVNLLRTGAVVAFMKLSGDRDPQELIRDLQIINDKRARLAKEAGR